MTTRVLNEEQLKKMKTHPGFIAALDQGGGSTLHALALYGIKGHSWADDDKMFDLVHQMRTRVITSPSLTGERIIGANYRWRKEYGGLRLDQAKRLKELEKENLKLKRLVAELSLEKQILKDIAEGNY